MSRTATPSLSGRLLALILIPLLLGGLAFPAAPAPTAARMPDPAPSHSTLAQTPPATQPRLLNHVVTPVSFDGDLRTLDRPAVPPSNREIPLPDRSRADEERGSANIGNAHGPALGHRDSSRGGSMPAPNVVFDGLANIDNLIALGGTVNPPDPTGDVGPNHYVEAVNQLFRIYNKTGTPLIAPTKISSLFAAGPSNTPCDVTDSGDPIIVYDPMADRWLVSQFSVPGPDYYECIAVSKTPDPVAGGWWLYALESDFRIFPDYPKLTVWPDAYYLSAPLFPDAGGATTGGLWALDRAAMLAGRPMHQYFVNVGSDFPRVLPSNLRGQAPPAGSPAYILSFQLPNKLAFWTFAVDWDTPANTTLTGPTMIPVDPFVEACPGTRDCVPFLGSTPDTLLDDLSPRLMMQLQYRRVGATESLWVTQTVSDTGRTALRWYELRDLQAAVPTVHQQSTYTPADGIWRWMGSIAADKDGNAAIGYSASSPTMEPAIWYSGRLATDSLNTLAQGDAVMKTGQTHPTTTNSRWGDYTSMSVDPVDDCTFWYVNEYYRTADIPAPPTANNRWATAIGSFKYPSCTALPATGAITGTVFNASTQAPLPNVPVEAVNSDHTRIYAGSTDATGVYTLTVQPGTYAITAGPAAPTYLDSSSVAGVVVTSSTTTRADIGLSVTPNLVAGTVTVNDSGPNGNANGAAEPGEDVGLTIALQNTGSGPATAISAQLVSLTPGVVVTTATAPYPTIAAGAAVTNTTPFRIAIDALRCGVTLRFRLDVSTAERSFSTTFDLPTGVIGAPMTYSSTGPAVAIPPGGATADIAVGVEKTLVITGTLAMADVNVTFNVTHTNDADVQAHLTSPGGIEVHLTSDNGGTGDNYVNTVFDDSAATPIEAGAAPFTGDFRPEGRLADLNGSWATGTWTLHAYDDATGAATGSLGNFSLTVRTYACSFAIPNLSISNVQFSEAGGTTNSNGAIDPGESPFNLNVSLFNGGIPNLTTATSVTGVMTPQSNGVTMLNATSAYPAIAPNQNRVNTTPYQFAVAADITCGVPLNFLLTATTAEGSFTDTFALPTGENPLPTVALTDTFEPGATGWLTTTTFPGVGWTLSTASAHSPTHAWNDSPGGDYNPSTNITLVSPAIDLSAYDTAVLSFWHHYDLEEDFDFGTIEYSTDGGATWTVAENASFTGTQAGWTQATVSIPGLAHAGNARVRFHMTSDTSVNGDGWVIDDVSLSGDKRSCAIPLTVRLNYLPLLVR